MLEIRPASFAGPRIAPKCASRMWFPLSVRNGSSPFFRNSILAPSASSAAAAFFQPNGWTSTGNGVFVPRRRTSLESSTMITNFFDAAATIFSRNRVPPRRSGAETEDHPRLDVREGGLRGVPLQLLPGGHSGPPAQFLDEFHELPDHEIIELLTQRLRGLRRISRDAGPVFPRVVHDR